MAQTSDDGRRADDGRLRIVFMGTPDFAARIMVPLARWQGGELVAAYCQPDRPAGRGRKLRESPVKALANIMAIPCHQPETFRELGAVGALRAFAPDVLVVAAYGLLLPQAVLDVPRLGAVNVHASLLPAYRGAAPIARAIMDGVEETGVSIMKMEAGLDAGPVYRRVGIAVNDATAGTLLTVLADLGGFALLSVLEELAAGTAKAEAQDESAVTWASKLVKEDGYIDWDRPAREVHNRIRGVTPRPGAQTVLHLADGRELRVILEPGRVGDPRPADVPAGSLCLQPERGLAVACADRLYVLQGLCVAGKQPVDVKAFLNGYRLRGQGGLVGQARRP